MTHTTEHGDATTHQRVLALVVECGPVTAGELARRLGLTAAAIRRHIVALETGGQIAEHEPAHSRRRGRGRPARHYVATDAGRAALPDAYANLANHLLRHLTTTAGEPAVAGFAEARAREIEERHGARVAAAGHAVEDRARELAEALSADGYAATIRTVGAGEPAAGAGQPASTTAERSIMLQLCQGHCPVQAVAEEFPHLCEAETHAISRMLGVHVQRLATLAAGGHACTTHIPIAHVPIVDVHHAPPTGDDTEGS